MFGFQSLDTGTFLNYTETETEDRHKQTDSSRLRYSTDGKEIQLPMYCRAVVCNILEFSPSSSYNNGK